MVHGLRCRANTALCLHIAVCQKYFVNASWRAARRPSPLLNVAQIGRGKNHAGERGGGERNFRTAHRTRSVGRPRRSTVFCPRKPAVRSQVSLVYCQDATLTPTDWL